MADIEELAQYDIRSVVVGKAIYEERISIEEIKEWNLKALTSL
jgi:phosphoribosylformimino-5-aminoimidazole carboxamide ribotide isomerase